MSGSAALEWIAEVVDRHGHSVGPDLAVVRLNQATLAQETGLSPSSVSNNVRQLKARQVVVSADRRSMTVRRSQLTAARQRVADERLEEPRARCRRMAAAWGQPAVNGEIQLLVDGLHSPTLSDIAELLGVNRGTAARHMADFKHLGLLRRSSRGLWLRPLAQAATHTTVSDGVPMASDRPSAAASRAISGVDEISESLHLVLTICSELSGALSRALDILDRLSLRDRVAQQPRDRVAQLAELREGVSRISRDLEEETDRKTGKSLDDDQTSWLSQPEPANRATPAARRNLAAIEDHGAAPADGTATPGPVVAMDVPPVGADGVDELLTDLRDACRRYGKDDDLDDRGRHILGRLSRTQLLAGTAHMQRCLNRYRRPLGGLIRWVQDGRWEHFEPRSPTRASPPKPNSHAAEITDSWRERAEDYVTTLERDPSRADTLAELDRAVDRHAASPLSQRLSALAGDDRHVRRVNHVESELAAGRLHDVEIPDIRGPEAAKGQAAMS